MVGPLPGENGSGKSAITKILVGELAADVGTGTRSGGLGFCPQHPVLCARLTCDDHIELVAGLTGTSHQKADRPGFRHSSRNSTIRRVLACRSASRGIHQPDYFTGLQHQMHIARYLLSVSRGPHPSPERLLDSLGSQYRRRVRRDSRDAR